MKNRTVAIFVAVSTMLVVLSTLWLQTSRKQRSEERTNRLIEKTVKERVDHLKIEKATPVDDSSAKHVGEKPSGIDAYLSKIEKIIRLERKVIRSASDNSSLEKALANRKLINQSLLFLSDVELVGSLGLKGNQELRMQATLFLSRALEWQQNPELPWILDKVGDFVGADSLSAIKDLEVRRSFAADKVELFTNLKDIYFEKGLQIEHENQSETNARLFRFANNFYKLNKREI